MNTILKKFSVILFILLAFSCNAPGGNENTNILIKTTMGDIKVRLYNNTPLHRDNFIKLVKTGYYDGISFHRVIKDFMIQAGDPATRTPSDKNLPDSLSKYTIPAEFNPSNYHKKGALAAAREGNEFNPEMRSSGTQFYIVQGTKFSDSELTRAEQMINNNIKQAEYTRILSHIADSVRRSSTSISDSQIQELASMKMFQFLTAYKEYKFSPEQSATYKTIGGVPRLDQTYTVFGEVTEGLDVVDKIASVSTDISDKPLNDVKILKMKILDK